MSSARAVDRNRRPEVIALVALAALIVGFWVAFVFGAVPAAAVSFGRVGYSGNPDVNEGRTCAFCHGGGSPTPDVEISGPASLEPGATGLYSVTITGGPAVRSGFNVSTAGDAGVLAPVNGDARFESDELTHSTPKPFDGNSVTFDFEWTAPTQLGSVTMYAAGNSTNGASGNSGDAVGVATFAVDVAQAGDPIEGADEIREVDHVVSCLAGNGRVDTNIVNTGVGAADYRIEFQGLSPRQFNVAPLEMWRMPITGRQDGDYIVDVLRSGVVVSTTTVTITCDTDPPVLTEPEVQVVHSCLGGNGLVRFQFVNSTDANRAWRISFASLANVSTSTTPYGQALRGISGRPDGTYPVVITLTNGQPVAEFDVTVDCSALAPPALG